MDWNDKKIASKGKPVIIASGASDIEEVITAMNALSEFDIPKVLMQCNTNYTADNENFKYINLNVLKTFSVLFPNIVLGLSDHTFGHLSVLGAVSLGAKVVEKHFTSDQNLPGRDNKFALLPNQFKQMTEYFDEAISACQFLGVGAQNSEKDIIDNYRGRWGG